MSEKQILISLLGGAAFALMGALLITFAFWLARVADGGDDGLAMITLAFTALSGIVGFILTARWTRKRWPDFQT